jgi:hypothetical protein
MVNFQTPQELEQLMAYDKPFCVTIYAPFVEPNAATNPNLIQIKNPLWNAGASLLAVVNFLMSIYRNANICSKLAAGTISGNQDYSETKLLKDKAWEISRTRVKKGVRAAGNVAVKLLLWIMALAVAAGAVYGTYRWQHRKVDSLQTQVTQLNSQLAGASSKPAPVASNVYKSKKGVEVKVYQPEANGKIASPLVVMGEVPGNWSFEASFPVKLLDGSGRIVAQAPAQLLSDWMTDQPVPFSIKLTFPSAAAGDGTLLLQKDNPSGLAANDESVSIPVKF